MYYVNINRIFRAECMLRTAPRWTFRAENNYKSAPGVNQGVWENSNSFKPSVSLGLQLSSCKKTHFKFVRRDTVALQEECWALFHRGLPVYLLCCRFQIKCMCDTVATSFDIAFSPIYKSSNLEK